MKWPAAQGAQCADLAKLIEPVVQQFAGELMDNGGNRLTRALIEGLAVRLRETLRETLLQADQAAKVAAVDLPAPTQPGAAGGEAAAEPRG